MTEHTGLCNKVYTKFRKGLNIACLGQWRAIRKENSNTRAIFLHNPCIHSVAFKAAWWVQTGMNRVIVDWIIRKDLPTFTSIKDHLREGATSYQCSNEAGFRIF